MRAIVVFVIFQAVKLNSGLKCDSKPRDLHNNDVNVSEYCAEKPCITLCCGANEMSYFNRTAKTSYCANVKVISEVLNYTVTWDYTDLELYNHENFKEKVEKSPENFNFLTIHKTCAKMLSPTAYTFHLLDNGSFVFNNPVNYITATYALPQDYCVEKLWHNDSKNKTHFRYLYYYFTPESTEAREKIATFKIIGKVISVLFMLLTLIVYCLLKSLRDHQGIILMCYVGTLMMSYTLGSIIGIGLRNKFIRVGNVQECAHLSAVFYFFTIASYFWLNIMAIQIWWTFRGNRMFVKLSERINLKRFSWYALYAWGVPLLLTIILIIIDNAESSMGIVKPKFHYCFAQSSEITMYLYVPLGILTVLNSILFVITIYNIWQLKRSVNSESNSTQGAANRNNQSRCWNYLTLAVLMGVNWLVDLISALSTGIPEWFTHITDAMNVLIGVVIFILFVCRKRVLYLLCKRFNINHKFVQQYNDEDTKSLDKTECQALKHTIVN